jgi:hypothetical protein
VIGRGGRSVTFPYEYHQYLDGQFEPNDSLIVSQKTPTDEKAKAPRLSDSSIGCWGESASERTGTQ